MRFGGTLEGTLVDIDDECLIVDDGASEIILEADAIAKIQRSTPDENARAPRPRAPSLLPDRGVAHTAETKSPSPFARAEDALRRRDLYQARRLFERAITDGDQPKRAVRRLADLLSTRLRKRDEAIALLERHKDLFEMPTDQWAWSQQHSVILENSGHWTEAAVELRRMIDQAPSHDDRIRVVKRTTAALIKTFEPDKAKDLLERELSGGRDEPTLRTILKQLNQAMVTGVYSSIAATLRGQAEATSELSPLLAFHLERCQYWGVRAESLSRREFTLDDIEWLDGLVSGRRQRVLGKDRPRERAEASLSAARIMLDLRITDDDFRRRLRAFALAMGDACVLEAKGNSDVIRAYYSEAVSVRSEWDDTVSVKLRQLVMSFVMADTHLDTQRLPSLETALGCTRNGCPAKGSCGKRELGVPPTLRASMSISARWTMPANRTTGNCGSKRRPEYARPCPQRCNPPTATTGLRDTRRATSESCRPAAAAASTLNHMRLPPTTSSTTVSPTTCRKSCRCTGSRSSRSSATARTTGWSGSRSSARSA
jgi:tetratricopeptide (TPR) repeat protein